ncbi:MAG: hypothetical protein NVSMB14_12550 [Isosphaeraceae bacterium]
MGWKSAASTESTSNLPLLKVEAGAPVGKRVRFLDESSCPQLAGSKYADGPVDVWNHWTPDALSEALGGGRTVPCIGPRNGCIFHSEPLNWKATKRNAVNCVEYVNYDPKKKTFEEKRIVGYMGGSKIFGQILTHTQSVGGDAMPGQFDFLITRKGTGKEDTQWTATMVSAVLEPDGIDLNEYPAQEEYGDDELPMVIDFHKFPGQGEITTPAAQRKWYEDLMAGKEAQEGEGAGDEPDPAAPPSAPVAAAPKNGAPIGMGTEKRKPGRPPKVAPVAGAPAATPAAPPKPVAAAPKPLASVPDPYLAASKELDPWGTELGASEHVDFIIAMTAEQLEEYQVTPDMLAAAKAVKKGPLPKAVAPKPPVAPAAPKPALAAVPAKVAPKPAPVAATPVVEETEGEELTPESMRAQIKAAMASSPVLKTFAGGKKFYARFALKALTNTEDMDVLTDMLALAQSDEATINEELG